MRIGMLTGGGDCPGLNAVIRAVVRKGEGVYGHNIVGYRHGWRGVMHGESMDLGVGNVRGALWLKLVINCAYNAVSAITTSTGLAMAHLERGIHGRSLVRVRVRISSAILSVSIENPVENISLARDVG